MSQAKSTLWGGRFNNGPSEAAQRLGESIHFDKKLYREDIRASRSHINMLHRIGLLSEGELAELEDGLERTKEQIDQGEFRFSAELEDIHTNIERYVTSLYPQSGGKIHTARSRNDQIITDTMLWLRHKAYKIRDQLLGLLTDLLSQSEAHVDTILPGYTHLQVAQPVRLGHHLMAYFNKFQRDLRRLDFALASVAESPLGVGAMAGVNYPTDRQFTAQDLGFARPSTNSMDTVSQRDWLLDFHHFASVLMVHMSRMAEELIIWGSQEFQFVRLSEEVTTGSSIMPQKRNPDVAELVRGKTGRIVGNHLSLLVVLKALPLTYNRDLQEDKESLFDSVETLSLVLPAFRGMVQGAQFLSENMLHSLKKGFALATDVADYLVGKGMPFRQTHELLGRIVKDLEGQGRFLEDLTLDEWRGYSELFQQDLFDILDYAVSTDKKQSYGSTSRESLLHQLKQAQSFLTPKST